MDEFSKDPDWFDAWCAAVPHLQKIAPRIWAAPAASGISFPAAGHATIVDIEAGSYWFNHRNQVIAAVVRRLPPAGPIFDIGGGNGYVSLGLRAAGFACVVVEPGRTGAQNAASRGFAVVQAPFQDLAIADTSIPAAGLFDVLEHIENDDAALANLFRVLAPGGRLYIAVPCHRWLWSQEDDRAGHFRRYTIRQLRARLAGAGFSVEYATYFFAILMLPILLLRALPFHLGRRSPETADADHALPRGLVGKIIGHALHRERQKIAAGKSLAIGASCLVVARKPA